MKNNFFINPKHFLFETNSQAVLYSGITDSYYTLDAELKKNLEAFINGSNDKKIIDKLYKYKLILKSKTEIKGIPNVENYLTYQIKEPLAIQFCPNTNKKISIVYLESFLNFCKQKNSHKILLDFYQFNNLSLLKNALSLLKKIQNSKFNYITNFSIIYSLVTTNLLEAIFSYKIKTLQIQIRFESTTKLKNIIKILEILYSFCKYNNTSTEIAINCFIDDKSISEYKKLHTIVKNCYYNFFNIFYTINSSYNSCPDIARTKFVRPDDLKIIKDLDYQLNINNRNFLPVPNGYFFCNSQKKNFYILDFHGNLYKCWKDIHNPSKIITNIITQTTYNEDNESLYIKQNSLFKDSCKTCFLEKRCKGYCPHINKGKCPKDIYINEIPRHYENLYKTQSQNLIV